jgi:hypothetical protein
MIWWLLPFAVGHIPRVLCVMQRLSKNEKTESNWQLK